VSKREGGFTRECFSRRCAVSAAGRPRGRASPRGGSRRRGRPSRVWCASARLAQEAAEGTEDTAVQEREPES
jgi:hypothetical protein